MKIISTLISFIYYMWIFISSFILVFLIGVFIWVKTKEQFYLYLFGFIGTVVGLYFIKRILKKVELLTLWENYTQIKSLLKMMG